MMFNSLKYFLELNLPMHPYSFQHIPKEDLSEDLLKIENEQLLKFCEKEKQKLNFLLNNVKEEDIILELKKYYILNEFVDLIPKIRLIALKTTNKPYNLKDLEELTVDKDGLVLFHDILEYNSENKYMLCLPISDGNSNYWLSKEIYKLKDENISFKIRLDPLAINPIDAVYKMTVFGEQLDWEKLSQIKDITQARFLENDTITELYWNKRENKLHFFCEELPKFEEIEYRGSRYFHAIYDITNQKIIHCDGSVKIYEELDFLNRNDIHLWDENSKNYGQYVKIFRADGEISTDNFTSLITSFFVRNNDISNYFKTLTKEN